MGKNFGIKTQNFDALPLYLKPDEVCALLRISKPSFYKRAYLRQLPITKIGGSLRVDKFKLIEYLQVRTTGGDSR